MDKKMVWESGVEREKKGRQYTWHKKWGRRRAKKHQYFRIPKNVETLRSIKKGERKARWTHRVRVTEKAAEGASSIYLRNPDIRSQWVPCDQEAKPVVKQDRFGHKVYVWWNIDGIVHYELVPDGLAVNAGLYSKQLSRVYEVLKTRYPALIN
ncbi:hypothetical protein LAZ67_16000572 [Cordylochernes scorpioides]|uniref:Transposase n=1 Tax=Cordylochernes scorpioides TaxID=51811 RepID=A0ABY6LDE1_9ARAC|nr:hypothetical protein LAZ67_16000572 [Cordylochernes scorpioides]